MRKLNLFVSIACCAVFIFQSAQVQACTGIKVQATDGSVTFARTMEFGSPLKSNILLVPKGQKWSGNTPETGYAWENNYAFLGPNAFDQNMFVEGMNEKGLYIGAFWFPENAKYPEFTKSEASKSVAPEMISALILGTCATIEDVRNKLQEIKIVNVEYKPLKMVLPLHWIVLDQKGNAIVIEPLSKEARPEVMENKVGVFTNSPQFTWHLQNLSTYVNLTPVNVESQKINGLTVEGTGEGSGMLGLPGDLTPPSRFIRAALYSNAAEKVADADAAVNQAMMLINNISIAKGLAVAPKTDAVADYTQWTMVYDFKALKCYFRTYNNQNFNIVDLKKFLSTQPDKKIKTVPMWDTKPDYKDVTQTAQ